MKCPHCGKVSKAKVVESRRVDGQVWRQRLCGACAHTFISTEITSADMKFPWADLERRKLRRAQKPEPQAGKRPLDFSITTVWR